MSRCTPGPDDYCETRNNKSEIITASFSPILVIRFLEIFSHVRFLPSFRNCIITYQSLFTTRSSFVFKKIISFECVNNVAFLVPEKNIQLILRNIKEISSHLWRSIVNNIKLIRLRGVKIFVIYFVFEKICE